MKAIVYERYGPPEVLHLRDVAKPVPKNDEILIRVRATSVTIGDSRMRSFSVPRAQWLFARLYLGITKPRRAVLGMEIAGDVEAVGRDVTRFSVGDAVFASTFSTSFGGYAEYKCMPQDGLVALKPSRLSYEEAAVAVGGGVTALRCIRQGHIQAGQQVLIYGASGSVGSMAVQLARHVLGAQVTGVCSSANLDWVRELGADRVIDYTREDFAEQGARYDVVFDAVSKVPPAHAKKALKPGGVYLNVHRDSDRGDLKEALGVIRELLEAGTIKPVIDRCYPLEQIVAAHRYVDSGHKRGNVAITVQA